MKTIKNLTKHNTAFDKSMNFLDKLKSNVCDDFFVWQQNIKDTLTFKRQQKLNKLLDKIKNKKASKYLLGKIYDDYIHFLTSNKITRWDKYYGKYTGEIISACFDNYPEIFNKDKFKYVNNFIESQVLTEILDEWKARGASMNPKYLEIILNYINPESDTANGERAIAVYNLLEGPTTKALDKK